MEYMPPFIQATYEGPEKIDYARKAEIAMEGLEAHPEDREYILAYAAHFLNLTGQQQRTIDHCRTVLPQLTIPECRIEVLRILAQRLETALEYEQAKEVLARLLEECDNHWEVEDIAGAYERMEDLPGAIRHYELLIRDQNADSELCAKVAALYEKQKDFANARRCYEMAGRLASTNFSWLWYNAGRAAALDGKEEEALFYLQMVLKMTPEDATTLYFIGQIYQNQSDLYRALHYYTEALKVQPDYPEIYNNLAALSFNEESNIQEAVDHIETALKMNPESRLLIILYRNLALLYHKIADYDRHEYYKGKMMEAIGFPVEFIDGEDDEEEEEAE